jgi:NTP pyrophosphatase (non-canonical NTP hydrolase)
MSDLEELTKIVVAFRDERDWEQFHDSKNLAAAISIEAAELNEIFLWKNGEQAEQVSKERLQEELADVFVYALLLAHRHGFSVKQIIVDKMKKNAQKYSVEKSKGNSKKYTEL